jgi:hypothetical protein
MDANGATKRNRGDIRVQLALSACVLLLPPLVMGAGAIYLGAAQWPDGGQVGVARATAVQAAAPQAAVAAEKATLAAQPSDRRPDGDTSFTLANTEQPAAAARVGVQPAPVTTQQPANAPPANAKQAARHADPAPATLANVAPPSEQTAVAEPSPSATKAADAPTADAAVPDAAAASTAPSGHKAHHETRSASRTKPVHIPLLSDIFQRPAARSR